MKILKFIQDDAVLRLPLYKLVHYTIHPERVSGSMDSVPRHYGEDWARLIETFSMKYISEK